MQDNAPRPDGIVADAPKGNWVDTYTPSWSRPYLRLSRADRPIGTWLLLIPCWWGLALSMLHDQRMGWYDLWIAIACAMGAFLMRGAGCTWNDFTDRHIDAQVARTRSRPIPSGQVRPKSALAWMGAQALVSFAILLTFNVSAILLGIIALVPVLIYPFAKRFTWWPQVFLGLAFNWGALLAWTAHSGKLEMPAVILYFCGIAWTLFYDTIYAHQDTEDDALIGVKSTARLFAQNSPKWLLLFAVVTIALLCMASWFSLPNGFSTFSLICILSACVGMGVHLWWQLKRLNIHDPANCLDLFRSNRNTGIIPLFFFAIALLG